jgi:hypothetical protein
MGRFHSFSNMPLICGLKNRGVPEFWAYRFEET